jgi:hypothetical protein
MGDHDAPSSWLERWHDAEPVRLYLWSVATAVIVAAGVVGLLTDELAVAITGVVSAVLMLGGTAAARRVAYAPVTVQELLERADEQATERVNRAYARGLEQGGVRTPEQVARDLGVLHDDTGQMPAPVGPPTVAREALPRCGAEDDMGARCTLPEHPDTVGHRFRQ